MWNPSLRKNVRVADKKETEDDLCLFVVLKGLCPPLSIPERSFQERNWVFRGIKIKTLLDTKKSIGKGDRAAILRKIHSITNGLSSESNFMFRQFQEQMDKTITQAKGEIEAFAQNRINTIAQQAIAEQKDAILKLENPVDISHMELDSAEGQNMEKLLAEVEKLNDNTPDGCIRDADTILVDLIEENDFEFFGFAHDIFNIWKNSSDKEAVEQMFYEFTDMSFKEYLEKCKREISR